MLLVTRPALFFAGVTIVVMLTAGPRPQVTPPTSGETTTAVNLRPTPAAAEALSEEVYPGIRVKKTGPWFLGTCTGTKGSGAWMREWIELQLLAGVDHVWVVNDNDENSTDATGGILKEYERLGYVTIIPGKMPLTLPGCKQLSGVSGVHNCAPVKYCFQHASPHVKWLLFADTDEFIYPRFSCSLREHFEKRCDKDLTHVQVRWERFGAGGHDLHPAGLMTENFLDSGGDCSRCTGYPEACGRHPFNMCPECRHWKVIFNTECAKEEHAGWIHWPVNTTDWKRSRMMPPRTWLKSEGTEAHWKHAQCKYFTGEQDTGRCQRWIRNVRTFSEATLPKDCCAAGIGYNHYGTKSRQYFFRKKGNKADAKRGYRAPEESINLGGTLSTDVLRFVRAMRKRMVKMGHAVSDNVQFVDPEGAPSCFVESNYKYTARVSTVEKVLDGEMELDGCCKSCHANSGCKSFVHSNSTCTLLVGAKWVAGARAMPVQPYHLYANREPVMTVKAGVPLRQGECGLGK